MKTSSRSFIVTLYLLLLQGMAMCHPQHEHSDVHHHQRKCGNRNPQGRQLRAHETRLLHHAERRGRRTVTCDELCTQCINVPVYFHFLALETVALGTFIPHPTLSVEILDSNPSFITADSFSTKEQILTLVDEQMVYLNNAYEETPFVFTHEERDDPSITSTDETWTRFASDTFQAFSKILHRGDAKTLNVYLGYGVGEDLGQGQDYITLGFALLANLQLGPDGDGAYMRYDNLPGGGLPRYDLGETLVHEVGHWLGLYHTFSGDGDLINPVLRDATCANEAVGDRIEDTPAMLSDVSFDCLEILRGLRTMPNSCPSEPGEDPYFNYMNYVSSNQCFFEAGYFTCGQKERMYLHWILFRDHVISCEAGQMEIEILMDFDDKWPAESLFDLTDDQGNVYFDSFADFDLQIYVSSFLLSNEFGNRTLLVDICVPDDRDYTFSVLDTFGDGFESGYYEIRRDGLLIDRFEGNFGASIFLTIPSRNTILTQSPSTSPTGSPTNSMPSTSPTGSNSPTLISSPTVHTSQAYARPTSSTFSRAMAIGALLPAIILLLAI